MTTENPNQSIQSLGGEARAKHMTPEQRSQSASIAAEARWGAEGKSKYPKALNQGELKIGEMVISCAVLDNGERVISDRTLAETLGVRGSGRYWEKKKKTGEKGALLPEYVSARYLRPFISEQLVVKLCDSITYRSKQGAISNGIKATALPEICDIWIKAKEKGALDGTAILAAERAYILMRAFATVGIIALVDEATGYQEIRDREALQQILEKYISGALLEWTKTFPLEFYKEIFRLKGWPWNSGKMPPVVGKYINDLVYDRLAPGVLAELQRLNPVTDKGWRRHQHHRYLTRDIGHPELKRRLYELLGMGRASESWDKFYRLVDRTFPRVNTTMALALDD